jgi:hypothetical protein
MFQLFRRRAFHKCGIAQMCCLTGCLIVCMCSLTVSCSSMDVGSQYDKTAPLAEYRTYAWGPSHVKDPISDEMVRDAIQSQLDERGYQLVRPGKKPDLIVVYSTHFEQRVAGNDLGFAFGEQPGIVEGFHGSGQAAFPYEEGEFEVQIIDANEKKVVWRGTGTRVLQPEAISKAQVTDAIDRVFDQYPVEKA